MRLLEAPSVMPLPGVDQMLADIHEGVRKSLSDDIEARSRPAATAEDLIKSDLAA